MPGHYEIAGVVYADVGRPLSGGGEGVELDLRAEQCATAREAIRENPLFRAVLEPAAPRHDEVSVGAHGDVGPVLVGRGIAVDLELDAATDAGARESARETAVAVTILLDAVPDRDRVAVVVDVHVGPVLVVGGVLVDHELDAGADPGRRESREQHAVAVPVAVQALPDHDETSVVAQRHTGKLFVELRESTHLELVAEPVAGARKALSEDAVLKTVLQVALPDHDEVASRVRRHRGPSLSARCIGVDHEFAADRLSGAGETPAQDALARAVAAHCFPHHDEVAVLVHVDGRITGDLRGVGVDLEGAGRWGTAARPIPLPSRRAGALRPGVLRAGAAYAAVQGPNRTGPLSTAYATEIEFAPAPQASVAVVPPVHRHAGGESAEEDTPTGRAS